LQERNEQKLFLPEVALHYRAPGLLVFFALLWVFSYFLTPFPTVGTSVRLDLVAAIVNDGTIRIDNYQKNTGDKAYFGGHYYCDKAPGLSLVSLPLAYGYGIFSKVDPDNTVFRYVMTVLAVGLPAALLGFLLVKFAGAAGVSAKFSVILAAAALLGTVFSPYATFFQGHVPAAALSMALFYIVCRDRDIGPGGMALAGFLAPLAVVVEYPAAIPAAALLALAAARVRKKLRLLYLLPGIAIVPAVFFAYNRAAFGGWLELGYYHEMIPRYAEGHASGIAGVTMPDPAALYRLAFQPGHGIFATSPFLLFAFPGAVAALGSPRWRGPAVAAVAIVVLYFLSIASYFEPSERHLVPAIPFLAFLCCFFLAGRGDLKKVIFAGLVLASVAAHALATASAVPQTLNAVTMPVFSIYLPLLAGGITRPGWLDTVAGLEGYSLWICYGTAAVALVAGGRLLTRGNDKGIGPVLPAGVLLVSLAAVGLNCLAYQYSGPNPDNHFVLGNTYLLTERYELAEHELEKTLEADPDYEKSHEVYDKLGRIAWKKNDFELAAERYAMALREKPSYHIARYNLAIMLHLMGRDREAARQMRLAEEYYRRSLEGMTGENGQDGDGGTRR